MKTNKPNVRRYYDRGCPEQICRVDTMHEMDDGDYVLYEDYESLQAEFEELRKDVEQMTLALKRIANMDSMSYHSLDSAKITAKAAMEAIK